MSDPRVEKLADILVNYSAKVVKGDVVMIDFSGTRSLPLIEEIYKKCLKNGARYVEYNFSSDCQFPELEQPGAVLDQPPGASQVHPASPR